MRWTGTRQTLLVVLTILLRPAAGCAEQQPPATPGSPTSVSSKAVEAMRLLESKDAYQRQVGFLRLEALREPGTVPTIQGYIHDKDPEIRAYSLRALAAVEGQGAVPLLLQALRTDKKPRVRCAALLGLEPLRQGGSSEILPAFIKALQDRNTEVRIAAVDVVSRIDDPRAKDAVRLRLKREHRRDVRRVLPAAMKRLGP